MVNNLHFKQVKFSELVAKLLTKAFDLGFEVTFGEAYRTPEQAKWNAEHGKGISNSLHTQRLAIDINLFKNGEYLQDSKDYKELGLYWISLSANDYSCCWGGSFSKPDGNHFSIEHLGIK